MYIPQLHEETDLTVLHAWMRLHPLGTWATQGEGELIVNHVPFLLDATRGPYGTLLCHVARANSVWQSFSKTVPSVIVFQGPDTYISPSWYPSKQLHGKVVPTWNYAVVHAHGIPVLMQTQAQLMQQITQLTATHESNQAIPWQVADAPADFVEQMSRQIVGIEIPITRIFGKWKVSQNRSAADRSGVVAGLKASAVPESVQMADLVDRATTRG
jgi:transcriptional regulator